MAPSAVPTFQLTLDNWAEWILMMIIVFGSYNSEGRLMIQCLQGLPYQLPQNVQFDTFLIIKCSGVLDAHGIIYKKNRRVTL